jgi:phage gp36-like protein
VTGAAGTKFLKIKEMLVSIEELEQTSLYPEIIQEITRGNTPSAERHILEAESLVRSYMSKYNTLAIFGTQTTLPTFDGVDVELIKKFVKIIASYFMVRLANPNVDIELYRQDYEDALLWLKALQAGDVNPDLPYKEDNPETSENEANDNVFWGSNKKRANHF